MNKQQALKCLVLLVLAALLPAQRAMACKCTDEPTVQASVQHAQAVVSGRVISRLITADLKPYGVAIVGDTTSWTYRLMKFSVAIYLLKIDKVYKGKNVADTLAIATPVNGSGCGVLFQTGERYIVYATTTDEVMRGNSLKRVFTSGKAYWTNDCTRTSNWYASEDNALRALGRK